MTKDEIIKEAKRRYPIGTKFRPAHLSTGKVTCIVVNHDFVFSGDYLYVYDNIGNYGSSDKTSGNNSYSRSIFNRGKWAEVIELPVSKMKELFPIY